MSDTIQPSLEFGALIADWLGHLFIAPPDPVRVAGLQRHATNGGLADLAAGLGCPAAGQRMAAMLGVGPAATVAPALARCHARLFDGVAGRNTIPPYESAWTGEGGRLFQAPTEEMAAVLRRLDLAVSAECGEPPDHLGIELFALAAALRQGDAGMAADLQRRLATWVPAFAGQVQAADPDGFHAAACTLLAAFLSSLSDSLHAAMPVRPTAFEGTPS
ncbi:Molecular chaperone TorD family protein [Rhodovastum atsumiense]|uniref:Molecular chaperone TorD family protein n=1 Tax=Rhodovastum atsumiense TaxID=504468 RepID=A0A5M6IYM7_9PROT|nr:molecular chaperone TorD family protein [Rhodovastum atsumiense]KAA5613422.1 molecular chaperone TorD family protein [Rhodovastum atsumiense]CAH2603150.1 Molecular chaperone TorD family protein [Rhodovastum atsumiense]